ncbi:MAG: xanthine dehydrogenase molybdopterin binding subunit [Deltaproteobacteria bacterium]|nr:xanthine dehydrogenase molybdopterin binding subunit [Deltaproteobacteria bacterium]
MKKDRATPLHRPGLHDSAELHVRGTATYVDDQPLLPGELHGYPVVSPHAHARITGTDAGAARALPGVHAVLFGADVPGLNQAGPIAHDEPLLADEEVHYVGQMVALVLAESFEQARVAAAQVRIDYEVLEPSLDLVAAIEKDDFLGGPLKLERGDVDAALAGAAEVLEGVVESPGQEHLYLETHAARCVPGEGQTYFVSASTQHPSECQAKAAEILGVPRSQIVVESPRMGGAFGGKESQGNYPVGLAVLGAHATGRPVRIRFDRETDIRVTGKRHPWRSEYRAGFDAEGRIQALEVKSYAVAGFSLDLSIAILQRCLFHLDNAYFVPNARYQGWAVRLDTVSNTAFRGFGGPQGMVVIEEILSRLAERRGVDAAGLRAANLYGVTGGTTVWGQEVDDRLPRIWRELSASAGYEERRERVEAFNQKSRWLKRGLAFSPVRFGISFTTSFLNQAGALVLIYADGSVQLNHGGTEMGQGLHAKMRAICAHELGLPAEAVRVMPTATDKVPNTSPTAASSGSDMNGQAVREACERLRSRLRPVAAGLLGLPAGQEGEVRFAGGDALVAGEPDRKVSFAEVAQAAYLQRVSLSATGYYATPDIAFDWSTGTGRPAHYFAFGGAITEVEVSGLTGEYRVKRVDILHDTGNSLIPTLDLGQIEGGFVQGMGWLTTEELYWEEGGRLATLGPSTYKIPAAGDMPEHFEVKLLERASQPDVIHGSKAVGEPPLMLALSVVGALRAAVQAFGPAGREVELALPATAEAVLRSVERQRA